METNYILMNDKKAKNMKSGDCFTFQFKNGDMFLGVILHAELDSKKWGNWFKKTLVVLFFKNKLNDLELANEETIKSIISDYRNLAIPPRIVDYGGWDFGYYKPIMNISSNYLINYLNETRFYNDNFGYTENVEKEKLQTNNLYLCGIRSISNCYGTETLMEISMDYDFIEQPKEGFNPYFYIDELIKDEGIELPIPDWYYKTKKRINIDKNHQIAKNC